MSKDVKSISDEFHSVVNMTQKELESWLNTEDSLAVGQKDGDSESIGHQSGKRIIELLRKKKADYTEDDLDRMKRVISYVHRHMAQQPSGDVENRCSPTRPGRAARIRDALSGAGAGFIADSRGRIPWRVDRG